MGLECARPCALARGLIHQEHGRQVGDVTARRGAEAQDRGSAGRLGVQWALIRRAVTAPTRVRGVAAAELSAEGAVGVKRD